MAIIGDIMDLFETRLVAQFGASRVFRDTRLGELPVIDGNMVIVKGNRTPDPALSCHGNPPLVAWVVPVMVQMIASISEESNAPTFEAADDDVDLVFAAICDSADWHTMGGRAINTEIGPVTYNRATDESPSGVTLVFNVTYRVQETDQTTGG